MTTEEKIKAIAAVVGLGGLIFGVVQFFQVQAIDAAKPYLEKKLAWCEEAVDTTAKIATADVPDVTDTERFWQLYWGVMGLIENRDVTQAMVDFGEALKEAEPSPDGAKNETTHLGGLTGKSLALAHACRAELSAEWSTSWTRRQ